MIPFFVWFLLFALPFVVIPIGISPFEAPKVVIAEFVIDILLFLKIISFKKAHFKRLLSDQTILLGILLILSLDQLLLFYPFQNFFGNQYRLQGVFLFWHLIIFSFISKDIILSQIPRFFYNLSFIFLLLATIILGVDSNYRAFGTLGEPNALAATILFIFPFVYFKNNTLTKIALTLSALLLIVLSGSRAGLIGLGIEILFITLVSTLKRPLTRAVSICFIFVFLSLIFPFTEKSGLFENRDKIWHTAIQAGLESPILGAGFGNIQNPLHQTAVKLDNPIQYITVDSAHNFILDWWIQGGVVGVISILTLIFLSFQGLIRRKKVSKITAFLGIITALMFNPLSIVNLLAFWWLIGQGFSES